MTPDQLKVIQEKAREILGCIGRPTKVLGLGRRLAPLWEELGLEFPVECSEIFVESAGFVRFEMPGYGLIYCEPCEHPECKIRRVHQE